jgi:hypothetical protein
MGFIRKTLFTATMGAVAPYSRKQRVAAQTLAAVAGKSREEVERAGTRRAAFGFDGTPSAPAAIRPGRDHIPPRRPGDARHRPAGWEGPWDAGHEWRSRHRPDSPEYRARHGIGDGPAST